MSDEKTPEQEIAERLGKIDEIMKRAPRNPDLQKAWDDVVKEFEDIVDDSPKSSG